MAERPLLITVLGVLYVLGAIGGLLGGAVLLLMTPDMIDTVVEELIKQGYSVTVEQLKSLFRILGIVCLVAGIVSLILAVGFFKGWTFVWYVAVIMTVLNIITGIALLFIDPADLLHEFEGLYDTTAQLYWIAVGVVVDILILYYLFRPRVKAFFRVGKASST